MSLQLLCLDPGFASLGYATLVFDPHRPARVAAFGVIQTSKSDKKHKVFEADDSFRRTMDLAKALRSLCSQGVRTVGICAEALSLSPGWTINVCAKMGMAWGVIASLSEATDIPLLQAGPTAVKKAVCGVKTATKEEVQEAVVRLYPEVFAKRLTVAPGLWEHCHDAVAVGHCMLSSDVVKMARLAS